MQILLNPVQLELTINRLAHQLLEEEQGIEDTVFIGLQPRGIIISDKLIEAIRTLEAKEIFYGKLDITFYRDDIRSEIHKANQTDIPFSIENKTVILIDDVLYTGRTVRAALDALQDYGRPKAVKLLVLVNRRFGREFPIQPDYCGLSIDSNEYQKVKVMKDTREVVLYS